MGNAQSCKDMSYSEPQTPLRDQITPTEDSTTYSKMSVDIFNSINSLRTDPTTFKSTATSLANTTVLNSYPNTALTAYKWSNALSMAALEYVNRKSINA